ncbi:unnamed protein product [Coffea canephora]|uniref:DH200=94 genomic scaffold, scaffold_2096 n=1 Tax=Coffea canephora TaxID=49390 RepID=A0A068VMN7_COFCA|nr:unnamed protein product [Coffea canephora]
MVESWDRPCNHVMASSKHSEILFSIQKPAAKIKFGCKERLSAWSIYFSCITGALPVESSSIDVVVVISKSSEFPNDALFLEISRILKPGGTVLVHLTSLSTPLQESSLERRLLLAGLLDVESSEAGQSIGVSVFIGSSFSLKKQTKSLPAVQIMIDDDTDLINEDNLLSEEDLNKPQLPVGDCEVGKTRKACKNCTCGRAEAEEKVKLGLTMDQLNNPQSTCGNCGLGDAFRYSTCPYIQNG